MGGAGRNSGDVGGGLGGAALAQPTSGIMACHSSLGGCHRSVDVPHERVAVEPSAQTALHAVSLALDVMSGRSLLHFPYACNPSMDGAPGRLSGHASGDCLRLATHSGAMVGRP